MRSISLPAVITSVLFLQSQFGAVNGHGSHEEAHGMTVDDDASYAQKHMVQEHHISDFDLESFFHLHDMDRDGVLTPSELEQIYGIHHETSQGESGSSADHERKSKEILERVLARLDKNGDGLVTRREFVEGGMGGLPDFKNMKGLGHHYDTEGEYFLHHEELYHSTPETQTDESYNHPEDIAHFTHHEQIELEEENKVRLAQGLDALDKDGREIKGSAREHTQKILGLKEAKQEADRRGSWGTTRGGFGKPKDTADRLRKSVPYKYRVKTNW
ncbi:hypothetical protein BT69DRAFT_1298898 [Atractiella rhizophila]|nr:hypothetical protein BT69DRAFT_1298898 [Atractiella rhizophila]